MQVLDDRGRVFGKVNIIDAFVGCLFVLAVPLGYGAWALFRVPVPTIISLTPTTVFLDESATPDASGPRIEIRGMNLRPFLNVYLNEFHTAGYWVQSTSYAEVRLLPNLAPGRYDFVLYDETQELVRVPRAITILPVAKAPVLP